MKHLSGKQIVLAIIIIIIIIWFISWIISQFRSNPGSMIIANTPPNSQLAGTGSMQQIPLNNFEEFDHVNNPPFTLYLFYDPECGACRQFMPIWSDFTRSLGGIDKLGIKTIDSTNPNNRRLARYYNITHNPTIILSTPHKNYKFAGPRSVDNITNFIVQGIKSDPQQLSYQNIN